MTNVHIPVLLQETLRDLAITPSDVVVDATAGGGGHSKHIGEHLGTDGVLIAIDQDEDALARVEDALRDASCTVHVVQGNFSHIDSLVHTVGYQTVNKVLFDLGLSTNQLELSGRGFSFKRDEPLLMTMSKEGELTAFEIVNKYPEEELANLIYEFGEERYSRRIAKAIVEHRKEQVIGTTKKLVQIIEASVPHAYKTGRINPATRTFQALRIVANNEMESLKQGLRNAWSLLAKEGRLAVISFHSLEDRIVKQYFASLVREEEGELLFKKPITPTEEEIKNNPKSRSAKLRIITKII